MHHRFSSGLLVVLAIVFSLQAFCGGTQDGGGGSEEAKMFMNSARPKVRALIENPKTKKFGLQLQETIDAGPVINLVKSLSQSCDGKALPSHYAYSCKGVINLLHANWGSKKQSGRGWLESDEEANEHWQDILHELARASDDKSSKYLTNDEGHSMTTDPQVAETVRRSMGIDIDIIAPSAEKVKASIEKYIQTLAILTVDDEIMKTKWIKVDVTPWWHPRNDENATQVSALATLLEKVQPEFRSRVASLVHYEIMKKCEPNTTAIKFNFPISVARSSPDSFGAFYKLRSSATDNFCAENANYVRAIVKVNGKLKSLNHELQRFLVDQHIRKTTNELLGTLEEFIKGLSAIEMSPVISKNRFASFGLQSSVEIHSWMTFNIAKVRQALAYVRFVDRLSLGYGTKELMYNLREQAVNVLGKLNQFEEPAIYVVQIDYGDVAEKLMVAPLFNLNQLRALVLAADVGLPPKGDTVIRNRSRVEANGYTMNVAVNLRCDDVFAKILATSVPQKIVDGELNFRDEATFLFKYCASRYGMKEQKDYREAIMYQGMSREDASEQAWKAVVKAVSDKPEIPGCGVYEFRSNSGGYKNSEGIFVGTGNAVRRWVCQRP